MLKYNFEDIHVKRCTKRALNILELFDWGISAPLTTPKHHPRKTEKAKRSKNDTSCHTCHKSSSPGCRRCFLFSGWPCPCLRSDLPILGWSMQWSNPIAKTKLAFKDNDIGNPKTKTTNWSSTKAKQTWRRFLLWWTEVSSGNSTRRALSWFLYLVSSYYLIGSTYYLVGGPQKSFLDLSPSLLTNGATMLENPRDKFKH